MIHNNRFAEFDRLHTLSDGATRESDTEALLRRMLDFAEAGVPGMSRGRRLRAVRTLGV